MRDGRPDDTPIDPDLLVLDEGDERALFDEDLGLEPEPVDSYVPPYVPDPPPTLPARARVTTYGNKSPRWFRVLLLLAVALIVAAGGAVLHRQGILRDWFGGLAAKLDPGPDLLREIASEPRVGTTEQAPRPLPPTPPPNPPSPPPSPPEEVVPPVEEPRPDPFPEPPDRLPDAGTKPEERVVPAVVVKTSGNKEVRLEEGEILVELRNGNFLKGRLHKVTDRNLRLAMEGGYVDVELSRLRSPTGEGDAPIRSIHSYPRARVQLLTGEVLRGRLFRSSDKDVELVFPSGRLVLRRDMVRCVDRR